ncbi:MAG: class I SAM-dependent methyltransferase [Thermoplasmata archaeon]
MARISNDAPPVVATRDRRCRGWTLDNWVRRWWAPAGFEADLLSIEPGQHVVDFGAGVGYLTPTMLERVGPSGIIDLVDPDPTHLSLARIHVGADTRVHLMVASAADAPSISDRVVDRVVLSLVLCCMVDKSGALDEAWRVLRPGGLALVTYPERRWRLSAVKVSLRVSPELWARLITRHPWTVLSSGRKRLIRRHLLQKPNDPV